MTSPHYRVEHVNFAWIAEVTEGQAPATINTNMGLIKGGIVLPDVEYAWDHFFGIGRAGRGRKDTHEGPQTFHGSVPVILVQFNESRGIIEQCVGVLSRDVAEERSASSNITYTATTLTDVTGGNDFTSSPDAKDGTHALFAGSTVGYIGTDVGGGITEVTVYPTPARSGTKGWNGPIPVSGGSGDGYEIRVTESIGTASGDKFITETQNLKTMTWGVEFRGAGGQSSMVVNYLGGKVNRCTISARQGQKLQLSLDDVLFRGLLHDVALPSSSVAKYGAIGSGSTGTKRPTASHPTEAPLVFTQGTFGLFELTNAFVRITSFSLSIDHQLQEQQYLSLVTVGGASTINQTPYEITEGVRLITCEVEGWMDNREYWEHLMRQGQNDALTAKTGFDLYLNFTSADGTENMWIQSPAPPSPGLVNVSGQEITGSQALASAANVGVVIEAAPHGIPAETESLIPIRLRLSLPSIAIVFDDS